MHFIFIYSEINSKAHLMRKPNDGSVNTNVLAYQIISQNLKVYFFTADNWTFDLLKAQTP